MADRVANTGSWAQSDVIQILQDNGILPSNANEGVAFANMVGSLASSYAENLEGTTLTGKQTVALKVFKHGVFTPVNVVVDYGNGTNIKKALAKAIASAATAEFVSLAASAVLNSATAPFAIALGVVAVGYFAGGFVANEIGTAYDRWVGPKVEGKQKKDKSWEIQSNYSVKETLLLEEYHQNLQPYENSNYKLTGFKDGVTLTHTINGSKDTYSLNLSKSSADSNGYIEALALYRPFMQNFTLKTTTGEYEITNLLKRTDNQIASLAKSDSSVMYALANLKSYAISGDSAASVDFTDAYIKDKAAMLYWHNVAKTSNLGVTTVDTQLRNPNLHYTDMGTGIEYGEGYFYVDYDKKITFGTDNGEQILGADDKDRLYGMGGNDKIVSFGGDDYIEAGQGSDTVYSGTGNDTLDGGTGSDTLHGGADNDLLLGGNDTDYLYGDAGSDTLLGGDDNATDILVGGSGEDVLLGQGGDDVMIGGNSLEDMYSEKVSDYLSGGSGYDTYYVSHQDIIEDVDGSGLVMFNDKPTNGKKTKVDEYTYEDDNFTYTIDGANLIVVDKMLGEYITILNYNDGDLGIGLDKDGDDKKAIELFVGDATTTEGGDLTFTVAITDTLKYDLSVDVGSYFNDSASADDLEGAISGTVVIKAGESSADFTIKSKTDDIDEGVENFIFAATGYSYAGESEDDNDLGSLLIKNAGEGSIVDGGSSTCRELRIVNNMFTCRLDVEQIQQNKKVA